MFDGEVFASSLPNRISVVQNYAKVYESCDGTSKVVGRLEFSQEANVLGSGKWNNFVLLKIQKNNLKGWIFEACAIDVQDDISPSPILDTNGEVKTATYQYIKQGQEFVKTFNAVEVGCKVKVINGWESEGDYKCVQMEFEGKIITCYLQKSTIKIYGFTSNFKLAFSLIIALVGIITLLFGVSSVKKLKAKRLKKQQKKQEKIVILNKKN
ncbi:MAG: hypothetical protein RR140_00220 [Clostridia bacterium]